MKPKWFFFKDISAEYCSDMMKDTKLQIQCQKKILSKVSEMKSTSRHLRMTLQNITDKRQERIEPNRSSKIEVRLTADFVTTTVRTRMQRKMFDS